MRRIALTLGTVAAIAAGQGVNFFSIEKEQALGARLAQDVRSQVTPLDNPAALAYVQRIGARLTAALPEGTPAFTYTWELISAAQGDLEPWSFPGGFIFVPSNLFLDAQNESEFAGVLAHAIAHISLRHGTQQETRSQLANYATVPLIYMGGWTGYGVRQASSQAIPLGMLQFQRKSETDADQAAVPLLSAAGFDPRGLVTFIERMQPGPEQAGPASRVFSPLPPRDERIVKITAAIAALPTDFRAIQQQVREAAPPPEQRQPPALRRPAEN